MKPPLVAVLLAALAAPAAADTRPDAEVEALQMPVWVVRESKRAPLGVGSTLHNGDQVVTGAGSRLLLRLADGSIVKLGENTRFSLAGMAQQQGSGNLFSATLGVLEGAFRFTTTALYKYRGERDVTIRFTTVTAGIRSTDLWGKSTRERDIVALLEGRISVTRDGEPATTMTDPGTVYQAPRNEPPPAIAKLPPEVLARFAAETELQPKAGVARKGGRWRIYAVREATEQEALAIYDRLREAGYPATIDPLTRDGETTYRVRVTGLMSEQDGVVVAVKLRAELGLKDVSVSLQ